VIHLTRANAAEDRVAQPRTRPETRNDDVKLFLRSGALARTLLSRKQLISNANFYYAATQQRSAPCRAKPDSVSLEPCCPAPNPGRQPDGPQGHQAIGAEPGQDRFATGNGQAPGTKAGLGVSGAGGSAAGWADRASGSERRRGAAGFFLAAFFRADFLVGFFLAAFPAVDLRGGLRPALRTGDFLAAFFLLAADLPAFFLRAAFFRAVAIPTS